ncbi:hypothetical protein Tcan_16613 [Toxocara canis]|uniref:Uncharacterized protein n=1 Tax=Toxocara canis TaxID=6265 RepID=A0A0B2V206_TOXCA|nr:hypothetical protein Tcan_16613 [Toxocara canis]
MKTDRKKIVPTDVIRSYDDSFSILFFCRIQRKTSSFKLSSLNVNPFSGCLNVGLDRWLLLTEQHISSYLLFDLTFFTSSSDAEELQIFSAGVSSGRSDVTGRSSTVDAHL